MATRKKTTKKDARKTRAKKAPARKPSSKVAASDGVDLDPSGELGVAAAKFLATGGDAEATEAVVSSAAAQAKKRQRVERDLPVGTVLRRQFKGRNIEVHVAEGGFEFEDQVFKSISAVAYRITGYGISGPVFFRLDTQK